MADHLKQRIRDSPALYISAKNYPYTNFLIELIMPPYPNLKYPHQAADS